MLAARFFPFETATKRGVQPAYCDTFDKVLVTNGIVLKWVSLQLGHGSLTVTEQHYASYMAMDGYQNPWMVPEGGLPSDLFERLDRWSLIAGTTRALIGTKNKKDQ